MPCPIILRLRIVIYVWIFMEKWRWVSIAMFEDVEGEDSQVCQSQVIVYFMLFKLTNLSTASALNLGQVILLKWIEQFF